MPPVTREAIIVLLNEELVAVLVYRALNGTLPRFFDARGVPALFTFVVIGLNAQRRSSLM